jgi:hypothetical protein
MLAQKAKAFLKKMLVSIFVPHLRIFRGKVSISQAELNEAPNGTIKTWFSLVSKKNANSAGRIYVSLRNPAKYVEELQPPSVAQRVTTEKPSAEPNTCVVGNLSSFMNSYLSR